MAARWLPPPSSPCRASLCGGSAAPWEAVSPRRAFALLSKYSAAAAARLRDPALGCERALLGEPAATSSCRRWRPGRSGAVIPFLSHRAGAAVPVSLQGSRARDDARPFRRRYGSVVAGGGAGPAAYAMLGSTACWASVLMLVSCLGVASARGPLDGELRWTNKGTVVGVAQRATAGVRKSHSRASPSGGRGRGRLPRGPINKHKRRQPEPTRGRSPSWRGRCFAS